MKEGCYDFVRSITDKFPNATVMEKSLAELALCYDSSRLFKSEERFIYPDINAFMRYLLRSRGV